MALDRRTLLIGGGTGIGLVVGWAYLPRGIRGGLPDGDGAYGFGPYLKITRDGRLTVAVPQTETGQGAWTALPQIVADEVGAAWENVAVEPAPLGGPYANPLAREAGWLDGVGTFRALQLERGDMLRMTAGATSIRAFERPLREAGAIARAMLVAAAADQWGVDPGECDTADGFVVHRGRALPFGSVAEAAANQRPLRRPSLREGTRARLTGQPLQRLDAPAKIDGSFRFAPDVRLPGMLFASARLAPAGGRVAAFERDRIAGPGVRHFAARDDWVAVAADNWWAAEQALKAADVRFTAPSRAVDGRAGLEAALAEHGDDIIEAGDYDAATADSRALAATYFVAPSQHHALEPVSVTVRLAGEGVEVWAATQAPEMLRRLAGEAADLHAHQVQLYPMPAGEPAGAAIEPPPIGIAVELARAIGRPVQLTLSASASHNLRPSSNATLAKMTALPGGGMIAAWQMRAATGDAMGTTMARLNAASTPAGLAASALDGAAPPYGIPNMRVHATRADQSLSVGYMRASPQREMAFVNESFIDEMARAMGSEPLAFRMAMLGSDPRLARCFQSAARLAGWDGGGRGSNMGIAGGSAFGSHIALVAHAGVESGRVRAHRLVAAVDCGRLVNPGLARQQVEGALLWGLGQALAAGAEVVAGMPRAQSFGSSGLPRIGDTPETAVHFVPSDDDPGGLNGLGATVVAPALANALYAATGMRLRNLPLDPMAA